MIRERIRHCVPALLLAVGLSVPLCGSMDRSLVSPLIFFVIAGVVFFYEAASVHKIAAWTAAAGTVLGLTVWILAGGGARILSDAGIAVTLRMRGMMTAVPLAAQPVSVIAAGGTTLLCCLAVHRRATCVPALMLTAAVMTVVWLTDSMEMIPWLLPALAAVLTMLMSYRFDDTPVFRVLPWSAALVAAAFLLACLGPQQTTLKNKADEIRQQVLDRLFFTEPRDVFSLYSVGYSPQGAEQLGGKPNPSDDPVMEVSTPKTAYLRGTVYNRYTGHGWQNSTGGRRYLWQYRRNAALRSQLFDETLPPESIQNSLSTPVEISVRMVSDSASTLFVPQRVRELKPGGDAVPYFSNSSEIFITRNVQAGDTWRVSAPLYSYADPGIGALTEICAAQSEDPRWNDILNTYLDLPKHLEKPIWELAEKITSGVSAPFEKAMAVQNYLIRNFRYTIDVGEHPENIDFVTSFLMETKKGYCTYFASAMTVLCRMAGLPARYVEGYLAEPDENGLAYVTGLSAHAWTEVYFKGFGWLTFDATPPQHHGSSQDAGNSGVQESAPPESPPPAADSPEPTATPTPPAENDENGSTPEPAETPSPTVESNPPETQEQPSDRPPDTPEEEHDSRESSSFPWWILLAAAAAAAAGLRVLMTSPAFRARRARSEAERFEVWEAEIPKMLKAEKLEREKGETPMAFARRVDKSGAFSESLTPAGECLYQIRYGGMIPAESDTGLMRDTARLIRAEMTRLGKLRYFLRRFFCRAGKAKESEKT